MNQDLPLVSIVMATYNRAATIGRAIDSVINQTYKNIELLIVDDGSTDNTSEILKKYSSAHVRVYKHEINKGVTAAKNLGLNQIKGEWFTILDSDDEVVPEAIETMMSIPIFQDKSVTAVTCNCWDTTGKCFSGKGLIKSQYLDVNTIMTVCEGEFWGITKTSLLACDRFNEKLRGFESVLWYKINDRAKRFYCHAALRIYHTEGSDRILKAKDNFIKQVNQYENLIYEEYYLDKMKHYEMPDFKYLCKKGLIIMKVANRKGLAFKYYELIDPADKKFDIKLIYRYKSIAWLVYIFNVFKASFKFYILRLIGKK